MSSTGGIEASDQEKQRDKELDKELKAVRTHTSTPV